MSEERKTRYEILGRAAWITLDSPDTRNALSPDLVEELWTGLGRGMEDPAVRCIVLTGNGPAFCAGANLKRGGMAETPRKGSFVDVLKLIWSGPKPVIAAVNGQTFGGGLGLVAAADIAIAAEEAVFSFSEVRIGVIPAIISVVVLPKLGAHHGLRLFLTGERFDGARAVQYGLVHRSVPRSDLVSAVEAEVEALSRGGPIALAEAKRLVRAVPTMATDEAFDWTERKSAELFRSEEAAEGMKAFASKRRPSWAER